MKGLLILTLWLSLVASVQAGVVGAPVEYREGDTLMRGYLAYDDSVKGPRPGILVVHEWWGHNLSLIHI